MAERTVRVNNGTGTLTDGGQAFVEGDSVDAGDIDGDGDLDLAFGVRGNSPNTIYVNNGTGTLTDSGQTLVGDARDIALVDLDGDGDLDLAYALRTSGNTVLTNNGTGVFTDSGQLLDVGTSLGIGAGDLDGDGDLDLVSANDGEPNTVWINDAGPAITLADSWQSGLTHTAAVVTSLDDVIIAAATAGEAGTYTAQNGFTLGLTQDTTAGGSTALGAASRSATGSNETVSMLFNPAAPPNINRQVVLALVLNVAP